MIAALKAELTKLRRHGYWLPAAIVALITVIVVGVAVALAEHSDGADDRSVCQAKTEALMRQMIVDIKAGHDPADAAPIKECTRLSVEARQEIMHDVLQKYGEQWAQAVTGTLNRK